MKQLLTSLTILLLLTSCSSDTLSNEKAILAINDYYKDRGCFSQVSEKLIDETNRQIRNKVYEVYEDPNLRNGKKHKIISYKVTMINGIQIADDGKSAIVDFTVKGKANLLYKFQKYKTCGDKDDFGPWDMVAEFVNYDTGWKIKSNPKMK